MKTLSKINIIDCTLRDGGYYNDWLFSDETIKLYLKCINQLPIQYVEIGFRFLNLKNQFVGPNGISNNDLVIKYKKFLTKKISIMLNGSDLKKLKLKEVNNYFSYNNPKKNSYIDLLRIACDFEDLPKLEKNINLLKKLNYKLALNLMKMHVLDKKKIDFFIKFSSNLDIECIYFADSFGSSQIDQIKNIFSYAKKNWNKDLGLHAHDNINLALANSMNASESGANFIDSTINGMGRGAGNLKTEDILVMSNKIKSSKQLNNLNNLVIHFEELKQKYGWGKNLYYFYSGINKIHPTYTQKIIFNNSLNHKEKMLNLVSLSKNNLKNKFDTSQIDLKTTPYIKNNNFVFSKNVILIGSGNTIQENNLAILEYIKTYEVPVFIINNQLNLNLKNSYYFCYDFFKINSINYTFKNKIIAPNYILDKKNIEIFNNKIPKVKSFLKSKNISFNSSLSFSLIYFAYKRVKNIKLIGFDGYSDLNQLHNLNDEFFLVFKKKFPNIKITSLTKSNYKNLDKDSIYKYI